MCGEFSCIFVHDGRVLWNLEHSHSAISKAAGLTDKTTGTRRRYLKVECNDLTLDSFCMDEPEDLPSWYEDHQSEFRTALNRILRKYADSKAKCAPLYADSKAKCAPLYADYEAKFAPLYADYKAKFDLLYADSKAKFALLYADYEAKRDLLFADYKAKRDLLDAEVKNIPGYIG